MIMERENGLFCEEIAIGFHECDWYSRLKPSAVIRQLTKLAKDHYEAKGLSRRVMADMGVVSLISDLRVEWLRPVVQGDKLVYMTYELGPKGAVCIRDYVIREEAGALVGRGRSAWLMCDVESHRILRPRGLPFPIGEGEDLLGDFPVQQALPEPEGALPVGERPVRFSDIDGNGHMNSAFYGDVACNCLPLELMERGLGAFYIRYYHEARLGDTLQLFERAGERNVVLGLVNGKKSFGFEGWGME